MLTLISATGCGVGSCTMYLQMWAVWSPDAVEEAEKGVKQLLRVKEKQIKRNNAPFVSMFYFMVKTSSKKTTTLIRWHFQSFCRSLLMFGLLFLGCIETIFHFSFIFPAAAINTRNTDLAASALTLSYVDAVDGYLLEPSVQWGGTWWSSLWRHRYALCHMTNTTEA